MTVVNRGKKSWEVRIQRKRILQKIGIASGVYTCTVNTSKSEAHKLETAFYADLDAGIIPRAIALYAQGQTSRGMTVADLVKLMERDRNFHQAESTAKLMVTIWDSIKDIQLANFDRHALIAWIDKLKIAQNSPGTIRKKTCAFRAIFDYAVKNNMAGLSDNVFNLLARDYSQYPGYKNKHINVKRDSERERRLNDSEEKQLRKSIKTFRLDPRRRAINDKFKPSLELMLDLALNTGMRLQELFLMEWTHIDWNKGERGVIRIPAQNTKGNYSREIPISSLLAPKLAEYKLQYQLSEPTFVLPFYSFYKCHRYNCSIGLSHTWKRLFDHAKLIDFRFHDLRHEAISRMVERTNLSETKLRQISGHKNGRTFDRYIQMRVDKMTGEFY